MIEPLENFLEDQHPLVRANLRLGLGLFLVIFALHVAVYLGVRYLETRFMFVMNSWLRLVSTLVLLMVVILAYNALKVTVQYMRRQGVFTWRSLALSYFAVIVLGGTLFNMPDVFGRAVAASAGRSYASTHREFQKHCDRWDADWRDSDAVTLDIDAEELGWLREEAEVFRVSNTIYFDFGDEDYSFGLACALRGASPSETGLARNFVYSRIDGPEYQFVESEP